MTGNNSKVRSLFLAALVVFSVFAGSIALTGGAAAQDSEEITNNGFYVQGQTLTYSGDADVTYVLLDGETPVGEYDAGSDGEIEIRTGNMEAGSYTLQGTGNDTTDISFYLGEQTLSAEFEDGTLTLDSNRADFNVSASSDELSNSEIETLLGVDDYENIEVDGNSREFTITEGDVDAGSYDIDFEVADTDASANVSVDVGEFEEPDVNFNQSVFETDRGDIAEIVVDFENGAEGPVNLTIGSEEVNYVKTAEVSPNSDGQAVVMFNTYNGNLTAEEGSVANANNTTGNDGLLDATDYEMTLADSEGEQDVGTLVINERSSTSFDISVATGTQEYSEVSEVENASVDRDSVVVGDVVVHRLEASGLEGAIEAEGGLLNLVSSDSASLTATEVDPGPNAEAEELDLSSAEVVSEDGVYYILVDTSDLDNAEVGGEYNVTLQFDESSGLVDEDETMSATFSVVEETLSLDTEEVNDEDMVVVRAEDNQTVSGETEYAPGAQVRVVVRSTGDSPFLLDDTAEVQDDGTFSSSFDFSDYSENTTFTVEADAQGIFSASDSANGVINPAQTAEVSISDQEGDGSTVTVDSVTLSEGGFVTIHDSSLTEEGDAIGSVLGTSEYLESGEQSDVEVTLDSPLNESGTVIAMPHMDSNGNEQYDFVTSEGSEDGPYTSGGSAVVDSAEYTVANGTTGNNTTTGNGTMTTDAPTTTDGGTMTTDEPTDSTTEGPGDTATATTEGTNSDGDGPGFGVIVALVALVAAALLAVRRDN
ncbi:BGTF surface domain-containing protein [Halomarina salina]|uniref:BGTF surface domain-containing protein n=1 Tax=Halomarina salina TaxID=1872699 RepID=A0ABD5RH32_9EURY|nr:BGTF surface domain-containing protein [Halomarina salina]